MFDNVALKKANYSITNWISRFWCGVVLAKKKFGLNKFKHAQGNWMVFL